MLIFDRTYRVVIYSWWTRKSKRSPLSPLATIKSRHNSCCPLLVSALVVQQSEGDGAKTKRSVKRGSLPLLRRLTHDILTRGWGVGVVCFYTLSFVWCFSCPRRSLGPWWLSWTPLVLGRRGLLWLGVACVLLSRRTQSGLLTRSVRLRNRSYRFLIFNLPNLLLGFSACRFGWRRTSSSYRIRYLRRIIIIKLITQRGHWWGLFIVFTQVIILRRLLKSGTTFNGRIRSLSWRADAT